MEFEQLYSRALARGLEPRFCRDEVALAFLHDLATRMGIPEAYEETRMRCKITGYLLQGKTLEEAHDFVEAESNNQALKTSCFPRIIFHLLDERPFIHVRSEEYYRRLSRGELTVMVRQRCPEYLHGDDIIRHLRRADSYGVPDADSLLDAKTDSYSTGPLIASYYEHRGVDHNNVFQGTIENYYHIPTYYREGDEFFLEE